MWQSAAFIASLQVKTRWEIDVKTFFSVFNDLIICVQPVKTWFQRSSHQGCVVYVVAAISARTLTAVAPRAPSHYDEMTAPRRPNCFRFVFIPRSAARLLLVSPLLAAIGPAACVRLCLSGATAALQRPGQADQSHHQSEETRAKTAGKCVPTSHPPPPLHTNKTKNNNCMMEKRLLLWLILIGGERILHCTTVTINPLNGFMVIHGFVSGWAIVWLTEFAQVTLRWLYWSGCMLIESPLQIWLWSHF